MQVQNVDSTIEIRLESPAEFGAFMRQAEAQGLLTSQASLRLWAAPLTSSPLSSALLSVAAWLGTEPLLAVAPRDSYRIGRWASQPLT